MGTTWLSEEPVTQLWEYFVGRGNHPGPWISLHILADYAHNARLLLLFIWVISQSSKHLWDQVASLPRQRPGLLLLAECWSPQAQHDTNPQCVWYLYVHTSTFIVPVGVGGHRKPMQSSIMLKLLAAPRVTKVIISGPWVSCLLSASMKP